MYQYKTCWLVALKKRKFFQLDLHSNMIGGKPNFLLLLFLSVSIGFLTKVVFSNLKPCVLSKMRTRMKGKL